MGFLIMLLLAASTRAVHAAAANNAPPPSYKMEDLGTGRCFGINEDGLVTGAEDATRTKNSDPFTVTSGGPKTMLGKFENDLAFVPASVNRSGVVVGFSQSAAGRRAVSYSKGTWAGLGFLGTGDFSIASDINEAGQIVGASRVAAMKFNPAGGAPSGPAMHAFLFSNGSMKDLDPQGKSSIANRISKKGRIAGVFQTAAGATHAFLYTNGKMDDLGTLGGGNSAAYGLNDAGQVVGVSEIMGSGRNGHAFVHQNGAMADINPPGAAQSDARAINDQGVAVVNGVLGNSEAHPFAYSGGKWVDLFPKRDGGRYWTSAQGLGITDGGAIVGWALDYNGANKTSASHCVVWRPGPAPQDSAISLSNDAYNAAHAWSNPLIGECFRRNGGAAKVGRNAAPQVDWEGALVQNYEGGSYGPCFCILKQGAPSAWLVRGHIRLRYISAYDPAARGKTGPQGFLGFPVEDEKGDWAQAGPPRQRFEGGAISYNPRSSDGIKFTAYPAR